MFCFLDKSCAYNVEIACASGQSLDEGAGSALVAAESSLTRW